MFNVVTSKALEQTGTIEEALRTCMQMAIIEVTEKERFVRLLMILLHGGNLNNHEKV